MSDLIQSLKAQTNLDADQVSGGLGALFDFLKKQLPPDLFSSLESALPQAAQLIQSHGLRSTGEEPAGGGGLLGSLAGMAGKIFGGKMGELSELTEGMGKAGFSIEQVTEFLPKALAMLKQVLPDDLIQKILAAIPALAALLQKAGKDAS